MARSGGDDAEFSAWYVRDFGRIAASLAVATGRPDLVEDATAEAFARALAAWPRVRALRAPSAWVYTVALNHVRSTLRGSVRERLHLARTPAVTVAPPEALDYDVWEAVASLPERQRTAIALRYVLDLPEAEIAAAMQVRRGTVAATLHAARAQLRVLLSPLMQENESP